MADEINLAFTISVSNGNFFYDRTETIIMDQATASGANPGVVNVGTASGGEVIALGDIATEGVGVIKNLDTTNFVEVGPESGGVIVPLLKFKPGEGFPLRLSPGQVYRARADTGVCKLLVHILED